ncbi:uncharacterized protein FIBRA_03617 [Fibroporia radiculosa]|uniref:Fanconi-associated nuclease n=1 Tax=Fibroporia radiculosa TaxID=599839 RepID=J4G622_9APHY|nr:uncharacterized protein FIBRA_03617 [Fibroporia radiculosa]CCM01558.1 predicted protein [Fibroporia radiculosa]
MVSGSPPRNAAGSLVYWDGIDGHHSTISTPTAAVNLEDTKGDGLERGRSMYVILFEEMLYAIFPLEERLFTLDEQALLGSYEALTYEAKYLLIRLCLRKANCWHRLDALNYQSELGDIVSVINALCGFTAAKPAEEVIVKTEEVVVDPISDDEDGVPKASLSKLKLPAANEAPCAVFADDESQAKLEDLLQCLTLPELKTIAQQFKVKKITVSRDTLISALLANSSTQSTLTFPRQEKGKMVQTKLSFPSTRITQTHRLRQIVMKTLKKCVRIKEEVLTLFRRLNLVYFRSTQHTPTLLTPSILARAHKRTYPSYQLTRTGSIWLSRDALIKYEEALLHEAKVDAFLEGTGMSSTARSRSTVGQTPGPLGQRLPTSVMKSEQMNSALGDHLDEDQDTQRQRNARAVKEIFEKIYPEWLDMSKIKEERIQTHGLERFDCGHILTRIVCKGASALGILREYEKELEVIESLLRQRRWRRGRRGRWHERRALILMTHFGKTQEAYDRAIKAVREAILDEDTHTVYRPKLERRLTILEKRLKIPEENRHVCEGKLSKAEKIAITGVRVYHRAESMRLNQLGRVVNKPPLVTVKESTGAGRVQLSLPWVTVNESPQKVRAQDKDKAAGKSVWRGRDQEEVSVEILALQHYENQGYRGFHCEGRILTTLYGLLFWDIIFADIPGAFETAYQSAPLDIAEDTFYFSRKDLADRRLQELQDGRAEEILERVYDAHAETQTWCVGIRWDLFQKQDLLEIARCLGGSALADICRLLCEDYPGRASGVPDLVVWNADEGMCKFVEVKGPGDTLQENQRVWIDVLLRAGVAVEECRVEEQGPKDVASPQRPKSKSKKQPDQPPKRKREQSDSEREVLTIESEDEPEEVDYSQLDLKPDASESEEGTHETREDTAVVQSPRKQPMRLAALHAEARIKALPPIPPPESPRKKRKRLL